MARRTRRLFYATREQLIYAAALDVGMKAGIVILVATFGVYIFDLLDPHVPFSELPKYWGLPVSQYLAATNTPTGWNWLRLVGTGDILNFVGIAFLAGVTVVCYARILPYPVKKRDYVFAGIIAAQIVVFLLGALDIFAVGH